MRTVELEGIRPVSIQSGTPPFSLVPLNNNSDGLVDGGPQLHHGPHWPQAQSISNPHISLKYQTNPKELKQKKKKHITSIKLGRGGIGKGGVSAMTMTKRKRNHHR